MNVKRLMADVPQDQRDSFMDSLDLASRINRELLDGATQEQGSDMPPDWFMLMREDSGKTCEAF